MQDYKREKPARVGGLNRIPDGSHVDTTNTDISDLYSDSEGPTPKKNKREEDRERAERRARTEAAKMERRWKKEAEEAAAALARESAHTVTPPRKSASPSKPSGNRQRSASRSASRRSGISATSMVRRVSISAPLTPVLLRLSVIRAIMMSIDHGLVRMFDTRTIRRGGGRAHRARRTLRGVVGRVDIGVALGVVLTR